LAEEKCAPSDSHHAKQWGEPHKGETLCQDQTKKPCRYRSSSSDRPILSTGCKNCTTRSPVALTNEIFESKGRTCGRDLENWLQAESELLHPVHVDVAESDEGLTVRAEVPGFRVENLKVGVEARRLTIAGQREAEEERRGEKTIYKESCSNEFLRVIDLPAEVVVGKAAATLRDGVLQLNMPKAASSTIGAGERQS